MRWLTIEHANSTYFGMGDGSMSYAILVVWDDGEEEYLNKGASISEFKSKSKAQEMADFMMQGMSDQVQSINVVPFLVEAINA